jgi:hypothetical protein
MQSFDGQQRLIAYKQKQEAEKNMDALNALLDAALAIPPAPVAAPAAVAAPPPPVAAIAPPGAVVAAAAPPAAVVAAAVPFMAAVAAAAVPVMADVVPDGEIIGCKLDVWKGSATRTKGGLMRQHLTLNRVGRVVSIKASNAARLKNNLGNYQFPINA